MECYKVIINFAHNVYEHLYLTKEKYTQLLQALERSAHLFLLKSDNYEVVINLDYVCSVRAYPINVKTDNVIKSLQASGFSVILGI